MRFFFYGTLLDPEVRSLVLGEAATQVALRRAWLVGYRRIRAREGNFPVLVRRTGGRVEGQLAEGLSAAAMLRIAHFEGRNYAPVSMTLIDAERERTVAWCFLASRPAFARQERWFLRRWQVSDKKRALAEIRGWMAEYGVGTPHSGDVSWRMRRWLRSMERREPTSRVEADPVSLVPTLTDR